jgi:hypothetical protein
MEISDGGEYLSRTKRMEIGKREKKLKKKSMVYRKKEKWGGGGGGGGLEALIEIVLCSWNCHQSTVSM